MKNEHIFPQFPKQVCAGDSRTIKHGSYTVTARVVQDHDSNPSDFDCYTPEQLEAWVQGEWGFYGVILSVSIDGYTLDEHAASLWAIECGLGAGGGAYIRETANALLADAIARADQVRGDLLQKLSAAKFDHPYQPHPSIAHFWDASCDELARDYRWVAVQETAPNKFTLIGFYDDINKVIQEGTQFARQNKTLIVSDQKLGDTLVFDNTTVE